MVEEVVSNVTCTEDGTVRHFCTTCDYSWEETLESTGHNYSDGEIAVEPTCTEEGIKKYTCSVCGETKEEAIPPQHAFEETVMKEATCRESGTRELICSVCGYETSEEIEATGHTFVDDTCTECDTHRITEVTPDTWYTYTPLDILNMQNCLIAYATPRAQGNSVLVSYYSICKECHILTDWINMVEVGVDSPVTKTYVCEDCGATTLVKFQIY